MGHTHGPWILSERHRIASAATDETEQWGYTVVATGNTAIEQVLAATFHVATVGANPGDLECESNARLIAAAPDLLEACELLLIYLGDWDDMENETCAAARKAIAKAKGGVSDG